MVIWLAASSLLVGCRKPDGSPPGCARLCATLAESRCMEELACRAECARGAAEVRAGGCDRARTSYLDCAASASGCVPGVASWNATQASPGCEQEFASYRSCIEPCTLSGMTHSSERNVTSSGRAARVSSELVRTGCAECSAKPRGASPGSACRSATVCDSFCCVCPSGTGRYRARVCANDVCADAAAACELARTDSPVNPCR